MADTTGRSTAERLPLSATAVALGWVLIAVTAVVIVFPPLLVYGLLAEYGAGDGAVNSMAFAIVAGWAALCGLMIAGSVSFIGRWVRKSTPWGWVVGVAGGVASIIVLLAAALLGSSTWENDQAMMASACSAEEIAAVDQLSDYGTEFNPAQGMKTGTCEGWIMMPGEDSGAVMKSLWSDLSNDGWSTADSGEWDRTWRRDGTTVRVWFIQSSEGSTGVGVEGLE